MSGAKSPTAQMIKELHEQLVQRKRYVHSEMTLERGRELPRELDIHVDVVETTPSAASDPRSHVEEFDWGEVPNGDGEQGTLSDEQQQGRYRKYIEDNIGDVLATNKLRMYGVEKESDILSVRVPGRNFDLVGRADLLILSSTAHLLMLNFLPHAKVFIEVKRDFPVDSAFPAISELIALDLLVHEPVMGLLTNLTDIWMFLWVGERSSSTSRIKMAILTCPDEAFEAIRTMLACPSSEAGADGSDASLPYLREQTKRRKLKPTLLSTSKGRKTLRCSREH